MTAPEDTGWRRLDPPLTTPWTGEVGPANALPEYPRPQLTRPRWLNLNGVWEYAGRPSSPDEPRPSGYAERILVPFPPESALSGIGRRDEVLWYRRLVEIPPDWRDQRILLHFGAVDQTRRSGSTTSSSRRTKAATRPSARTSPTSCARRGRRS
ncbi:hypothetical protein SAMN05421837_112161 [Amycolatopsis pretoriensis]|uniref:Beta-galactosidase n=1 Tax=Amycolatopsis pretoriensis TaxID=218821 RepID=A0A1H5RFA4_9PSEU|nr:hypothetical protein SAMN05421837_112161 [Amycolatopsis pretoriensis]